MTGGQVRTGETAPVSLKVDHAAYPALFLSADASSTNGQRTYRRLVEIELAFVLAGAMFGTLGAFLTGPRTALASLATICLLGSMAMKYVNRSNDSTSRWFDGRAVAETVKTQTWRYMMRVDPYAAESSGDRLFAEDLIASMRARPDLRQSIDDVPTDARQITATMRAIRAQPFHERRDLYIDQRLSNQIAWYHGKAVRNARNARRWFWLSLVGQAAAAIIAFTSIFEPELPLSSLVGFFAALATAATAWTQLGRHDELSKAYALAYQELIAIRTIAERATSQAQLQEVVRDGEGAISREHTMWMAKREHETGSSAGSAHHPAPGPIHAPAAQESSPQPRSRARPRTIEPSPGPTTTDEA
jgi:hypothetical protein